MDTTLERRPDRDDDPRTAARVPLLDAILDGAHEAFISIDEDGRIRAWNREAERTFGWAREAVVGRLLADTIVPSRFRALHQEGLRRFLRTGEGPLLGKRVEITALHRNGHEFPVELTISALRHDGRWTFHAFLHDISDRYRAHEIQSRLATLVEHSADAIVTRNADGKVLTWNPGAERLYGYSADEMRGRNVDRLVPPDRKGEADELVGRVVRGEPIQGFETQRLRKDGSLVDVSITISPIRDDAGRVTELSLIARDISERKRAERARAKAYEDIKRASELKSQFIAITSHELRTPLTSIGGFARTMLEHWDGLRDEDKRTFLESIDGQAARLRRLVDDLLLVSRIEAGRLVGSPCPVDVCATARAVANELGLGDLVEVEADDDRPLAQADPDHAHQILVNYLENARRYGAPPYRVRVRAEESSVVAAVSDHGPGVPEEFVPSLFETFTQATSRRDGTGLGLAIVRGLAETAGGEVWYEPNEPTGARFVVRLPRADAI